MNVETETPVKVFKPTPKEVLHELIGRDPSEKLVRKIPYYPTDLKTHTSRGFKWYRLEKIL